MKFFHNKYPCTAFIEFKQQLISLKGGKGYYFIKRETETIFCLFFFFYTTSMQKEHSVIVHNPLLCLLWIP